MTLSTELTLPKRITREAPPLPWWKGAVIYQIYPRSFMDANGDGIGDLAGITARLNHVASLGVDGIWLSPFFTSPMRDFGYDIADMCDVDPIFGTLEDLDQLIATAHSLGLKVIIDQVYSHTSDLHAWFQQSRSDSNNPKADWYVWADAKPDGSPPSNWQSVFGGPAWTWDARRGQYYLHNFLPSQPDLNVHNPKVQDALLATAQFWMERGVDGFRLDALNFTMHNPDLTDNPAMPAGVGKRTRPFDFQHHIHNQSQPQIPAFLERLRRILDAHDPNFFTVAEVGGSNAIGEMKLFTQGQERLNSAYGFEFLYADRLTARLVKDTMALWPGVSDEGWPSFAFSNHDAPRAISRWTDPNRGDHDARLFMALLLSLRGNIFIYQGEELGLPQSHVPFDQLQDPEAIANWPQTLGRDGARTPMPWTGESPYGGFSAVGPWLPIEPKHLKLSVQNQSADPGSMLSLTRQLLALRNQYSALRFGELNLHASSDDLVIFTRGEGDQRLLCAFNLSQSNASWRLPTGWELIFGHGLTSEQTRPLGPMSGLIARRSQ